MSQNKRSHLAEEARSLENQLEAIRRKVRAPLEAEVGKGGLTGPQVIVMRELIQSDGLRVKELSARIGLAHSTVCGIIDRLEKQGLVLRRPDENDRRVTRVEASDRVRSFLKKNVPALKVTPLLNALQLATDQERLAIREALDTLDRLLRESER